MLLTVQEQYHKVWKLIFAGGILNVIIGLGIFFPVFRPDTLRMLTGVMILLSAVVVAGTFWGGGRTMNPEVGILQFLTHLIAAGVILASPLGLDLPFIPVLAVYFGVLGALAIREASRFRDSKSLFVPHLVMGITSFAFCLLALVVLARDTQYALVSTLAALAFLIRGAALIRIALVVRQSKPRKLPPDTAG
ncbi:MAG: hypothetical protein K1X53_14735 [Candidatus Sumerlaeaceae bacterium]|nr:hypothetical protein [Candidatus Sumerlaeaceae bacterium]